MFGLEPHVRAYLGHFKVNGEWDVVHSYTRDRFIGPVRQMDKMLREIRCGRFLPDARDGKHSQTQEVVATQMRGNFQDEVTCSLTQPVELPAGAVEAPEGMPQSERDDESSSEEESEPEIEGEEPKTQEAQEKIALAKLRRSVKILNLASLDDRKFTCDSPLRQLHVRLENGVWQGPELDKVRQRER